MIKVGLSRLWGLSQRPSNMDMALGSSIQCTGAVRRFSLRIIRTPHSNLYIVLFWLVGKGCL